MNIQQKPTTTEASPWPDDCADCGTEMLSKMIGKDRVARCVTCHVRQAA